MGIWRQEDKNLVQEERRGSCYSAFSMMRTDFTAWPSILLVLLYKDIEIGRCFPKLDNIQKQPYIHLMNNNKFESLHLSLRLKFL